jgi:hypothetical protein
MLQGVCAHLRIRSVHRQRSRSSCIRHAGVEMWEREGEKEEDESRACSRRCRRMKKRSRRGAVRVTSSK